MEEHTEGSVDGESTLYTSSKLDLQDILQKHGISSSLTFDEKTMVRKTEKNNFAITVFRNRETQFCIHLEINHRYRSF
jgi:hypothetical protein